MPAERAKQEEDSVPPSGERDRKSDPGSRRGDFGISAAEQLGALEASLEAARQAADGSPESKRAIALAEKKVELFVNEHDNAGAFKFKKFGREAVGFFEDKPGRPKVVETDPEGRLVLAPAERNRRMMFVNMGELDRVNKEGGGHAAGDDALKETVRTIERAVRAKLGDRKGKQAAYTMLRYRGNEFMVSFEDVSEQDLKDIMDAVEREKPSTAGLAEGAPLVAQGFEFQEALDIVNQLQAELPEESRIDLSDPASAAREVITVMNKRADYALDLKKFRSRVERVREKNKTPDGKAFFDNYMKKMFQGTDLENPDAFEGLTKEQIDARAYEYAGKALGQSVDEEKAQRAIIDSRVKDIAGRKDDAALPISAEVLNALAPHKKLATVPKRTRGQSNIDALDERVRETEAFGEEADVELVRLDRQIESARRDGGTGLLERAVHYENLEKAFEQGKEVQMVFVDMGFLRYFDNKGGADVGNDALKVAADLMEEAIDKSGVEGAAYRYGGDEFTVQIEGGPAEIAKFQRTLAELRANVGAIPTGKRGSEDGYYPTELVFNYGSADMETTNAVFDDLKEAGTFASADLEDPAWVANKKAEIMTMIADKSIEEEKAIGRFQMLIEAKNDPEYAGNAARKIQVDNLVAFSNKALFAELGGGDFLNVAAELQKKDMAAAEAIADPDARAQAVEAARAATRERVEAFVAERIQENRDKEDRKADLLTELIELHSKIRDLEDSLVEARQETEEEKRELARLAEELRKTREERQQLLDVRKTLSAE